MDVFKGITYKRGKSLSSSPRSTSINDLKGDELIEILIRVPIDAIHRFKCVSKYWLALISDSSFIRSYIRHCSYSPWCNDFIVWQTEGIRLNFRNISLIPSTEKSKFSCNIDHSQGKLLVDKVLSFSYLLPEDLNGFNIGFNVEGVSYGLLLFNKCANYYVCNPLTKQLLKIPPMQLSRILPFDTKTGFMCYSLDFNLPHKVEFIIVKVESKKCKEDFFYTQVFTSKTSCWTRNCVPCPSSLKWESIPNVVVYKGKFHWNADKGLVVYDPLNEPCKCSLIPIPKEAKEQRQQSCNCVNDDKLNEERIRMVTSAYTYVLFYIYELIDYEKGEWCLKYSVWGDYFHHDACIDRFISSPTNDKSAWVRYLVKGHLRTLALLDLESVSIRVLKLPKDECVRGTLLYGMPSWPTVIPQLR